MKRILLVSYYYKPFKGVGAARMTYWAENLNLHGYEVEIITAIPQPDTAESDVKIHFVPNERRPFLVADLGMTWKKEIIEFLKRGIIKNVDYTIISGGPFMHFGLTNYLKKKLKCKVVLDFRDPFASNDRFKDSIVAGKVKKYLENKYISKADGIISVNQHILNRLKFFSNKFYQVIENGFDERFLPTKKNYQPHENIQDIVYAGKFYDGCDPSALISVLNQKYLDKVIFHYLGDGGKRLEILEEKILKNYGLVEYERTMSIIDSCEIGLILTEGKEFETLTKPFDYMACEKKILIITEGKKRVGALHELTKDYPNVFWSENNDIDIDKNLHLALNASQKSFNADKLARKEGLKKLVSLLNEI